MENFIPCDVCGAEVETEGSGFDPVEGFQIKLLDNEKTDEDDLAPTADDEDLDDLDGERWKKGQNDDTRPGERHWVICLECAGGMGGMIDRLVARRGETLRQVRETGKD